MRLPLDTREEAADLDNGDTQRLPTRRRRRPGIDIPQAFLASGESGHIRLAQRQALVHGQACAGGHQTQDPGSHGHARRARHSLNHTRRFFRSPRGPR